MAQPLLHNIDGVITPQESSGFSRVECQQTPKIATRAAIFKEDKILLVCESDGRWVMPGGWCDVDQSPAENMIKEVREEAGLDISIESVIAVLDRAKHNVPEYAFGVTIIFFLCKVKSGEFVPNIETIDSKYFTIDELPNLAEEKCTLEEIDMCFKAYRSNNWKTYFD